jgi:hypothetical protein
MNPIEFELNGAKLKVYPTGEVWKFGCKNQNSKEEWIQLFGREQTNKDGYNHHRTKINQKEYVTSRIIYKAFNLEWNITNTKNNEIDHIDINSLNNHISNLRIATSKEQKINTNRVINAKGFCFKNGKYEASIKNNRKSIYLGRFNTEEEALTAYKNAIIKYRK